MKMKLTWLIFLFLMPAVAVKALDKKITTSDGVELFVTVKGEGIPCLYIHGGPGSGGYWLQAFSGDILEKKFKMIYLDQRGVSRSGSPQNKDFSLARMLKDFEEVREALHIKKWLVLGHSFGAGIQTSYAAKYPQAVAGMMMINGTVNIGESLKGIIAYTSSRVPAESIKDVNDPSKTLMEKMMICHRALGDDVYKMYYKNKASSDTMMAVMNRISKWNSDFSSQVNNYPEYFADFSALTTTVRVSVLVFSGNTDYAIGPEHYKLIRFPEQLLIKVDCGHLPFIEAEPELEKAINQYLSKYFPKGIS
ncbi:MAG TPA: alpha/beta hydrolase [Daejeonella sp.]|nr:alpha/beta hydrolase [Daejeonella sp.]